MAKADWRARNLEKARKSDADYRKRNPEKLRSKNTDWRKRNPEKMRHIVADWKKRNRDRVRQKDTDWAKRNPEKKRQIVRDMRKRNPERTREHGRKYRDLHPLVLLVKNQRRRAKVRNLPSDYTADDFRRTIKHFGECCAYCSVHISECKKLHMDHYVPLTHPDCPGTVCGNIVPACPSCNSSKGDRDVAEWLNKKFPNRANAIFEKIEVFLMAEGAVFRSEE